MNLVVTDGYCVNPGDLSWEPFSQFGNLTVYDRTAPEELLQRIQESEILIINKTPINDRVLSACPKLKLICVQATGYNVVDIQAARARGIPVCNVPDYGTAAVAQFTFALLLELCHQVGLHHRAVQEGEWASCPDFSFWKTPQTELAGKTLGIIGFGRIGRAVGAIAKAFGMQVLACNPSRCSAGEDIATYISLEALLTQSDVVSLHCPLTSATQGIIDEKAISLMKDGAILLNTSRGPLVDEAALAQALRSGKLRGAAADVVSKEPIDSKNPLLSAPTCILTPHMAWAPRESRQRIMDCTLSNITAFLEGKLIHVVNL